MYEQWYMNDEIEPLKMEFTWICKKHIFNKNGSSNYQYKFKKSQMN